MFTKESALTADSYSYHDFVDDIEGFRDQLDDTTAAGRIGGLIIDAAPKLTRGIMLLIDGRMSGIFIIIVAIAGCVLKILFRKKEPLQLEPIPTAPIEPEEVIVWTENLNTQKKNED